MMLNSGIFAQETTTTPNDDDSTDHWATGPTPTPMVLKKWMVNAVPWDDWFKGYTKVTDKKDYIYLFWNAQDFKSHFEVKEKKVRMAEAALELAVRLGSSTFASDLAKVDIVYVLERDNYNMPKWETLQKQAHFEFSRSLAMKELKSNTHWTEARMRKIFKVLEFY
jgi:hypothetical protein